MELTPDMRRELNKALLSAFPTEADLVRLARFYLNEHLGHITSGPGYIDRVFQLVEWADAQGRVDDLVRGALQANPGNEDLCEFNERLRLAEAAAMEADDKAPTPEQIEQLHEALCDAFLAHSALKAMVRREFSDALNLIAEPDFMTNTIWELIRWAASQGRVAELAWKAHEHYPHKTKLQSIAEELGWEGRPRLPIQPPIPWSPPSINPPTPEPNGAEDPPPPPTPPTMIDRFRRAVRKHSLLMLIPVFVLAGVALGALVVQLRSSRAPETVRIGITPFTGCEQESKHFADRLTLQAISATVTLLTKESADTLTSNRANHDLIISGQCRNDQLSTTMAMPQAYGPPEVVELGSVDITVLINELDDAVNLSRAVTLYLASSYSEAASAFATLRDDINHPGIAFMQGNSLLFERRYSQAQEAFEVVQDNSFLAMAAANNSGVAAVNWAHELGLKDPPQPFDVQQAEALKKLTMAAETLPDQASAFPPETLDNNMVQARAFANRAALRYLVTGEYKLAVGDCQEAIRLAQGDPLGFVCRAAATFYRTQKERCNPQPDTTPIWDDLVMAEKLANEQNDSRLLSDIAFLHGSRLWFHVQCSHPGYTEAEAMKHFRRFRTLSAGERVHLSNDLIMLVEAPEG